MVEASSNPSRRPDQYEMVLDALPDVVLTINRDHVITSFNRAAEELSGMSRANAVGRRCRDVLHNAVCDHIAECPLTEMLNSGGKPAIREFRLPSQRKHLAVAMVRVVLRALRDPAGEIVGGIGMISMPDEKATAMSDPSAGHQSTDSLPILDAWERRGIESVLRRHEGNVSAACRELGISRITLWRKMRKLGISRQ